MNDLELARRAAPCQMCKATGAITSGTLRKVECTCTLCGGLGIQRTKTGITAIVEAAREEGRRERLPLSIEAAVLSGYESGFEESERQRHLVLTLARPTSVGWYWAQHGATPPYCVQIVDDGSGSLRMVHRHGTPVDVATERFGVRWAGPIAEATD